jgi:hypothetical protein
MNLTGVGVSRFWSRLLYLGLLGLIGFGGVRLIDFALDARFYHDFLLKWEMALQHQNAGGIAWPYFSGANHLHYMQELTRRMQRYNFQPPSSNTHVPFVYRLHNLNEPSEQVFLLALADRIVVYRLPKQTFNRLDGFIDHGDGPSHGAFTGRLGSDARTYTGQLRR